ncbi:MAG: DUF427 domain-containing protein [Bacteroidota bacterium]
MKKQAIWNGQVIAESDDLVNVEGNYYFPKSALVMEHFKPTDKTSICPWKGTASYYTITVDGSENQDAAWYYPAPKDAAKSITDRVAFWKGVEVVDAN